MAVERAGPVDSYLPINAYALIGDCHSAALVSNDGSIDWYCPGRFDAPAVFCRLLDVRQGGSLRLGPRGPYHVERRYRGASNVLETSFTCGEGAFRPVTVQRAGRGVSSAEDLLRGFSIPAGTRL